jgi:hypothetical protein
MNVTLKILGICVCALGGALCGAHSDVAFSIWGAAAALIIAWPLPPESKDLSL